MMYYNSVFVTLLIVIASLDGKPTSLLKNEPERCCFPKQYSSKIIISVGYALPDSETYSSYSSYNVTYDADRGMIGMKGLSITLPDQQKSNMWIIENIKDEIMYTIDQDLKTCVQSKLISSTVVCIPDTAEYFGSSRYGYGDKKIVADTWIINNNRNLNYVTVSRDGLCVPLTGNIFARTPAGVSTMTTTDFAPEIDDPRVFDMPDECKKLN
ncbi:unnamed protein product [Rotaria sp. Silwood2]|nr:unnamed protein product [Rotaria sp. Silwood2]CAF4437170.1 unnamed protein product [Rotaria sp. Silwood2]